MQAIHGGTAKNDKIDSHKIALLLRGGMLPQAYVSPAALRATGPLVASCNGPRSQRANAGTSGAKLGKASLPWAFSEAAVLLLRNHPTGQQYLARLENHYGKGKACTIAAHT